MSAIEQLFIFLNISKYALLYLGCIIEGPVVMLTAGFFYKIGQFDFWPMFFALLSGDLTADIVWYFTGRFGARKIIDKFGKFFGVTEEIVLKMEEKFQKHQNKILFINKITMGFGFSIATLIAAGMMRVSFKKYITLNFLGGIIWTGILILIGFIFGNIYQILPSHFKFWFVLFGLIILSTFIWYINKYFKKKQI